MDADEVKLSREAQDLKTQSPKVAGSNPAYGLKKEREKLKIIFSVFFHHICLSCSNCQIVNISTIFFIRINTSSIQDLQQFLYYCSHRCKRLCHVWIINGHENCVVQDNTQ